MDPLLDSAPFGFLVSRDDGTVEAANRTLATMLGTPVDQLVGGHVDNLLARPSRIFYQSHFFPVLKLQGSVNEVYLELVTASGGTMPVLMNAHRRETPEGPRNDWAVVHMRTRSDYENEILAARRLAEEASRAKDEFISFASHELRSPLSAIVGWTAILKRDDVDRTRLERGIEGIERNARLQLKLVDDMLDHARLATGKVKVDIVALDARPVLESVLDSIEPAARAKGLELRRRIEVDSARLAGDEARLQQVFWNLLNNAVKFTPEGGTVTATLRRADRWFEVVVADTGKGIDPGFLPYVFESFRQEEGRVVRAEGGLGLGMAISRQLVELHGGSISVASDGPGKGAAFTLRLPGSEVANDPARRPREVRDE